MRVEVEGERRISVDNTATHTPTTSHVIHALSLPVSISSSLSPESTSSVDSGSVVPTGLSEDCATVNSDDTSGVASGVGAYCSKW